MKIFHGWISVLIVPILFLFFGTATLSDYGINWDEPTHFNRGQGYLHYFFTGNREENLPITNRPTFFQNHAFAVKTLVTWDGGHPVTSDILAALSNFIFYQLLGVVGDVEGYHLYNVFAATLAVVIVALFAYKTYGLFTSIVSSIVIASYPLFFAEAHFNIKDPPQTAFFIGTIFAFWLSLEKGSWKWLVVATLSAGLALGTKFNILFIPFIIVPYLIIRYFTVWRNGIANIRKGLRQIKKSYWITLILAPLIVFGVFFITWPFLWENPVKNLLHVAKYYKDIGTGFEYQPIEYRIFGFKLYPLFWIIVTTPPLVLFLSFFGIIYAFFKPDKKKASVLWLLLLIISVMRVSFPNTTIYGGSRQIMEFIPALALLAGLGASAIVAGLHSRLAKIVSVLIVVAFIPHFIVMVKLHPNQNVYFNSFIGGLSGAKARDIPSWGNSYGNAYWQAIKWLNKNAEQGAKFALVQGTGQNIAGLYTRPDIIFSNTAWSGVNRDGEYLVELTYENSVRAYPYVWEYIEAFLTPVYEVSVDGVAIAKVWKNDLAHTQIPMQRREILVDAQKVWDKNTVLIDAYSPKMLTRVVITPVESGACNKSGKVKASLNSGSWGLEPELLGAEQVISKFNLNNGVNFYFPARKAQFVRIDFDIQNHCYSSQSPIYLYALE